MNSAKRQQDFWQTMHNISHTIVQPQNNISFDEWFQHFINVLEIDTGSQEYEFKVEDDDDDDVELEIAPFPKRKY